MKIKVCGMRQPENIDAVAGLGINYMGFIFYPKSPRYITDLQSETIYRLKSLGVEPVALFVDEQLEKVTEIMDRHGFRTAQLHGNEGAEYCASLKSKGYNVIKAIGVLTETDLGRWREYQDVADMLVIDTKTPGKGGSGKKFDWEMLTQAEIGMPFLLSGGIGTEDAAAVKSLYSNLKGEMIGVDLNSRFEVAPGLKDITLLSKFIDQLK